MKKPQRKSVVIRDYQKLASLIEGAENIVRKQQEAIHSFVYRRLFYPYAHPP